MNRMEKMDLDPSHKRTGEHKIKIVGTVFRINISTSLCSRWLIHCLLTLWMHEINGDTIQVGELLKIQRPRQFRMSLEVCVAGGWESRKRKCHAETGDGLEVPLVLLVRALSMILPSNR